MPVIAILIKFFPAFCNSQIIIITTGFPYIKEIRPPFTRPDSLAVNTFHLFVIIFVRHFYSFNFGLIYLCWDKDKIVFELAK